MARPTTNAFRSLAAALLAPLALNGTAMAAAPDSTAKVCRPPALEPDNAQSFDLNRLKAELLVQMAYSGIPQPVDFIVDGEISDPIDHTRRIPHAREGSYIAFPATIIGISAHGTERASLSQGIYGGNCSNYLERHFDAFRHYAAIHEAAHHIDASLRLTGQIIARLQQPPAFFAVATTLMAAMPKENALKLILQEHLADAAAAHYELTLNHTILIKAVEEWRDASLDTEHFSGRTLAATQSAFLPSLLRLPDLRDATEKAAVIVESRIDEILRENAQVGFARQELGVKEGLDFDLSRPSPNPIIQNAQIARARLCRVPLVVPAAP